MAPRLLILSWLTLAGFPLAPAGAAESGTVEEVLVVGQGSQVELAEPFAGGQVARGSRAGLLGNLDMMEAPFNSTAYTQSLIQDQQARSVGDVLQNDPAVRVAKGFGNFQELYVIRGFPVFSDDMTFNGVYGILPRQFVAAELLERVEVFHGANSFLNGAAPGGSGVGGAFNMVPKRAGGAPLTRLTLGYENDGQAYAALDAGRRFGGGLFGARLNVVGREGEIAVDDQGRSLRVASLNTDFQGERLRLYVDIGYQDHFIDDPLPQVTPIGPAPAAPDAADNFAQPWTFSDEQQLFGVARGEYDLTDRIALWLAFGGRHGEEENRLANPSAISTGASTAYRFDNTREDGILSADGGLRFAFATGPLDHRFTLSASALRSDFDNAFALSNFLAPFAGNLRAPVPVVAPVANFFTGGVLDDPRRTEAVRNWGAAFVDTIGAFDGRVLATVGLRSQTIEKRTFDYNTGAELSAYDEQAWTPLAGLVVVVHPSVSLYANYAESLQPGEVAPAVSGGVPIQNAGEILSPYRGEQVEVGAKLERDTYGANLAFFTLNRPNAIVENGIFSSGGEQESRGIELSFFGEPLPGLRVLGGTTWLDSSLERTTGGIDQGNTPIGIPDVQANGNVEWDLPYVPNLTLDARVIFTGEQYIDTANTLSIPSWTRLDLGARYATRLGGQALVVRGRIENIGDRDYWASAGGFPGANYLVLGAPRSFILSASMDF
ncbi:MAG TPA: TonB-dependent siderophore receptor [Gammaproteobacteria bacterium]|nr:TonB-dependent siderophore receptor [Gammaproteobacteria bacterium]